jgi:hypothetical protein
LAVSLFPFLAVLICTLGVLIVLLVLAVKSADMDATNRQAAADDQQQQQLKAIEHDLEAREIQIDGLQMVRPEALERLSNARRTRSHFEAEIRRLQVEAEQMAIEVQQLQQQRAGLTLEDVTDEQLESLREQIKSAKVDRELARAKADEAAPVTWSIVPYKGANGTNRRPIYLECTADQIVIQPLGIAMPASQFEHAALPYNMIDTAVLAIREYWQRYDPDGKSRDAYPLLIVRAEGARSFRTAKRSLHGWDDEFGYELVGSDKNINFGVHDPELEKEVRAAIAAARPRHQRLVQVAQQRQRQLSQTARMSLPKSNRRPGLTVSQHGGGFVHNGVQPTAEPYPIGNSDGDGRFGNGNSTHAAPTHLVSTRYPESENTYQQSHQNHPAKPNGPGLGQSAPATSTTNGAVGATAAGQLSSATDHLESKAADSQGTPKVDEVAQSGSANTQSIANQRGSGWALHSRSPGAVPHVRPIRVICLPGRLIVRGTQGDQTVPIDQSVRDAVDPLVNVIWKQIERWGVAGSNAYWKPQLRVTIANGAEAQFEVLRSLLADSGVIIQATGAPQ